VNLLERNAVYERLENQKIEIERLRGLLRGLLDYIDMVDPRIDCAPADAPGDDDRIIAAEAALRRHTQGGAP
jgi:hypothetical protein